MAARYLHGYGKNIWTALLATLICLAFPQASPSFDEEPGPTGSQVAQTVVSDDTGTIIRIEQAPGSAYAPNQIILKFKSTASQQIRNKLTVQLGVREPASTGIVSIDKINAKHRAVSVQPVFKGLHRQLKKGQSLSFIRSATAAKYPRRARRSLARRIPDLSGIYKVTFSDGKDLNRILADYRKDPNVEYAEPNYIYKAQYTPSDPYFSSSGSWGQDYDDMWGLKLIDVEHAWDTALASPLVPVTVAVIDTGVDYYHEDLAANMWINSGEIPSNGIDDDGNGLIDDYYGYDFSSNEGSPDPMDDNGHGTHVAGTIAAVTDNSLGIAGIALSAHIMAIKGLNSQGTGYASQLADAIYYATDNGAEIQNYSWGGGGESKTISEAISYAHAHGCVLVAAAGNENDDVQYYHPACVKEVITVAATDHNDIKSSFSNYGRQIDVAAPGGDSGSSEPVFPQINVLSLRASGTDLYCFALFPLCDTLIIEDNYYRARGTSMAAPHVAGLAALILSVHPGLSNEQVRQAIRISSDDLGDPGFDDYYGYGRINASRGLQFDSPCNAWIASPGYHAFVDGVVDILGSASGDNFQSYCLEYGVGDDPPSYHLLAESTTPVVDGVFFSWNTDTVPMGNYTLKLTVKDTLNYTYEDTQLFRVDSTPKTGWPADLGTFRSAFFTPTFADVDGDGYDEVISPTFSKLLYVFRHDGTLMEGWPVHIGIKQSELNNYYNPPAVGDVDKDGMLEIFINTFEGVYAYDCFGNLLPGWPQQKSKNFAAPVALADVNEDSYLEIIGLSRSPACTDDPAFLYVWRRNGSLIDGFPVNVGAGTGGTNLAVGDINNANVGLEIVVPVCDNQNASIKMFDFRGQQLMSRPINGSISKVNTSVGDVNNDGLLEIVYITFVSGNKSTVGVLDNQGNQISEWTLYEGRLEGADPALGNLDSDGDLEIVAAAQMDVASGSPYKTIYAWNYDGSEVAGWPIEAPDVTYVPVLADIDGDGDTEVISSLDIARVDGHKIYAFHGDGSAVSGWPIEFYVWPSSYWLKVNYERTTIGDIDHDGRLEVGAGLGYGLLYVAEVPGSVSPALLEWPMAFHDAQRRSNYNPDPVAPEQVIPVPIIHKLRPGRPEAGQIIRIVGEGFGDIQGDSVVHIGNQTFDSISPRIKLWSDTKIRIRIPKYKCRWFKGRDFRPRKVWVTVDGINSNIKRLKVMRPAACP